MCRFARECLVVMHERLISLESKLGPETAQLGLRIGLHSGPVTAGVLRGDRYACGATLIATKAWCLANSIFVAIASVLFSQG